MNARPRRQQKHDRLIAPDSRAEEVRCDVMLAPFDRTARAMDDRWGIDVLPSLVSTATAARYGSAMAKMNEAIRAANPEDCRLRAEVCIRGLEAMDAEAVAAGHKPNNGEWWEYEMDGTQFAIVRDIGSWPLVKAARPDLVIYSLREIALLIKAAQDAPVVAAAKDAFPSAQISRIAKSKMPSDFWERGGDDLPPLSEEDA